ncbi:MAG TPA: GNAT family protein [Gemmatimonadales bacterium]|nr:GNAT family protein [Gemmatimonadales bacterium]
MKLLSLDSAERIELAAGWLNQEENNKWLDFGSGVQRLAPVTLKMMTQRDLHVLRLYTPPDSDLPIGVVGLSNVDRRFRTAGSLWAVLGRKRYGGYAGRAAWMLLTLAFKDMGLESVGAWTVEGNVAARKQLEWLGFRYIGRQRRCHWIDGQPCDRLLYDLLAGELRAVGDD